MKSAQTALMVLIGSSLLLLSLALVACGGLLPTSSPSISYNVPASTPTVSPTPTHYGLAEFGKVLSDESIVSLTERHNLMIWRAYTKIDEFGGTWGFRGPVDLGIIAELDPIEDPAAHSASAFLREVRASRARSYGNAASGSVRSYAQFLITDYTAIDMEEDADIRDQGTELLTAYNRVISARDQTANGAAHIYAIEVYGSESNLRLLGADALVTKFNMVPIGNAPRWSWPSRPNTSAVSGAQGTYDHLSGVALYEQLRALAQQRTPTPTPTPTAAP